MIPDTLFTQAPHWHWLVVLYFFFGGLSAGSFFLAAMVDLFGHEVDHPLARLGYYTSLLTLLPTAPLLILDLNRPERFWHMLFQSERFPVPMFKWWSPMSAGSWALLLFGGIAFLMVVGALAESGRLPSGLAAIRRGPLKATLALVGGLLAFFIASYTGVLLSVTNRPMWADTTLLGLLFLLSATSTSAALLILLSQPGRVLRGSVAWLQQMDTWALMLEFVVLLVMLLTLGTVFSEVLMNVWGGVLLAVVAFGMLLPLFLHWRPGIIGARSRFVEASLVLAGGFLLRAAIVLSSEGVGEVSAWLQR